MATTIDSEVLVFMRSPGDAVSTQRVILDADGPPYSITARYWPVVEGWLFTVSTSTASGVTRLITDFLANAGEDLFANIVTPNRPQGYLYVYNRNGTADPDSADSFREGIELHYLPPGTLDVYIDEQAEGVVT